MNKKYLFHKKLKKRNNISFYLLASSFFCAYVFFWLTMFIPELEDKTVASHFLLVHKVAVLLYVLSVICKIIESQQKYDSLFVSLYKKLKTVDSLSQPERDELMESLYHEYQLAKQANNKVITQELPTFIKIENMIKDDVIRRTQKNISDFNAKLKQKFNQLEKPVQDLINIEDYLLDINMKAKSIDDLEKYQHQLKKLFKKYQDKFDQKIISVKQKLLLDNNYNNKL